MESRVKSLSELSFLRVRSSMSKVMVCCGGDRAKVACGCSSGRQGPEAPPAHLPCPCCLVATFLPILLAPSTPNPPDPPQSTEHCDWLYGIFGHETSCTRYWTCWNGENPEKSIKPASSSREAFCHPDGPHFHTDLSRHSNRTVLHWRAPLQRGDPRLRLAPECSRLPEAS